MTCGTCRSFEQAAIHIRERANEGYCVTWCRPTSKDLSCLFWREVDKGPVQKLS